MCKKKLGNHSTKLLCFFLLISSAYAKEDSANKKTPWWKFTFLSSSKKSTKFTKSKSKTANTEDTKESWWKKINIFRSKKKKDEVIEALKNNDRKTLKRKRILITCHKAPNKDVPSFGFGDAFLYFPRLCEYLKKKGVVHVAICPPKPLAKFFKTCSDLKVVEEESADGYHKIDCRDLLDNIKDFHKFKSKKRYLVGKNCKEANELVEKLADKFKRLNIKPIIVTRQASNLPKKYARKSKFKYMNHRSVTRDDLEDSLEYYFDSRPEPQPVMHGLFGALYRIFGDGKKEVRFYNIQFEDQRQPDILGMEKPEAIWKGYKKRRGAFVNDAILMKAALKAGGKIISVDTAAANLAVGIPHKDDPRKNVCILLGKEHNSRWKGKFLNEDGSSRLSNNIVLFKQKQAGDWNYPLLMFIIRLLKNVEKN
ncbi:hypothetical protein ACFLYA_00665 [Candidatus Dependentiae bacterium]